MANAMDIAMGLLGGPAAMTVEKLGTNNEELQKLSATPTIPQTEASKPVSRGTELLKEKIEAGREILKLMEEQQKQNMEYAKHFADIAKSIGWPTDMGGK